VKSSGANTALVGKKAAMRLRLMLGNGLLLLALASHLYSSSEPVGIRLAGDEWFLNSLTKTGMTAAFERKTGIHVEVLHQNDRTIMSDLDRVPTSDGERLDVIVVRHRLLGTLVQKGQVQAIDGFLADPMLHDASFAPDQQLFADWWHELSFFGGHAYGFPFNGLTALFCYRKDLLNNAANQRAFQTRYHRKLTIPRNWEEYNQIAEFFTRPAQGLYGTYIQGKEGLALWYEWLNLIYSFGGNVLDAHSGSDYGDIVVNSPQNVAATTEYLKLMAFSPPDTLHFGWGEAQSSLQQGRVFMGLLWNDQAPFLEDPAVSKVAGKIGYRLIPSVRRRPFSQLEGLTYLIPTQSKHAREAYRFLEFAMSNEVQVQQTLAGGSSLRKSVYSDEKAKALPYTQAFLAAVEIGIGKPTIPESPQMTDVMVRRLAEIVAGKTAPQAGLDQIALELKAILGDKARLRYRARTP